MTTRQLVGSLDEAIRRHRRGDLDEAAGAYRAVLAVDPDQPVASHLLGVVAHQRGDHARAVELIARALAINPSMAAAHANLGEAYRALGQYDRAGACCRMALRLQPKFPEAANSLGVILLAQGREEAAIDQLRAAIRMQPDFAMAHNNLANALRTRGDKAGALDHFLLAARHAPETGEIRSNLGQALLELRRAREALVHCNEAVRLRPDLAEAHNNLGNVLRELGRLTEAKAAYAEALRINPDLAITYNNLGQVMQEEGRLDDAITWYRCSLALDPGAVLNYCGMAEVLEEQRKHEEAVACCEEALRLDSSCAEAHSGLGAVRQEQGRFEEAAGHLRRAIRLRPDYLAAHCDLGIVQMEVGDLRGAEGCFRAALEQDPALPRALSELAMLLRGKLPEADLAVMNRLLADPDLPDGRRSGLHFGAAHVLDAHGDYDRAAEHLRQANAMKLAEAVRRGQGYEPADHERFVEALVAACTPAFFERVGGFGLGTDRPIFIVGLPRSGTTLTEQILAGHSRVFGAGELPLARESFESLPRVSGVEDTPAGCLGRLDREATRRIARDHLDRLGRVDAHSPHVVDKMPDNYLYLGLLATLFPRARFIHCRRDLRDVAVSCWMTNFRQIRWANDPEHIASRFAAYRRLMDHWDRVLPVPVLEVDYEETVADLEGVARRLVDWCGLDWEPACLSFHESRRPVRTASVIQVRQPIYTRSVERWRNYEAALGPLFDRLEPLIAAGESIGSSLAAS